MKRTALKKLRDALIGALVALLIMILFMAGPYPEGTKIMEIKQAHLTFIIGSAVVGAIVALALTASNSD